MPFQNTPIVSSRIVLQTIGFWDEYFRIHHLIDYTHESSASPLDALADLDVSHNYSLWKEKGVLD